MFNSIKLWAYHVWDSTKAFFNYSKTVFVARTEAVAGIMLGAVNGLDWSALLSLDLQHIVSDGKTLAMASALFIHGLVIELARRIKPGNLSA